MYAEGYNMNVDFEEFDFQKCGDVNNRMSMCFNQSTMIEKDDSFTFYDAINMIEWADFVGPVIMFPMVSALGFILNGLTVVVISRKKYNDEYFKGARMYQIIYYNSLFNMIECFIALLSLYGKCIRYQSIYCPSAMEDSDFHIYRVAVTNYGIEAFKTCSIVMGLGFSLDRYFNISDSKSRLVLKFQSMNIKGIVMFALVFGFVSSFYETLEDNSFLFSLRLFGYPAIMVFYNSQYWVAVVHEIHFFINDSVIFILNLIVDLLLVIQIRKDLAKKKKINLKTLKASKSKQSHTRKTLNEIKKSYDDTNKMVLLSLGLYVVCRLPELAFEIHLFLFKRSSRVGSYSFLCLYGLCVFQKDFSQFLYLFSYCLNIISYYKYNKNFRLAVIDFKKQVMLGKLVK